MRTVLVAIASLVGLAGATSGAARLVPTPIGSSPAFHPAAPNTSVEQGESIGSMTCDRRERPRVGVHLELFADGLVIVVPAGIGIAAPLEHAGAYVLAGRCSYSVRTREPTGLIEVAAGSRRTLGDFFAVWGRALGRYQLAGFQTRAPSEVRAYVNGRRVRGSIASVALRRHGEIVVEIGRYVAPHVSYRFRSGL